MPQTEHSTVYTSQLELELGINFAPAIVREHGLRDAHLQPLVAWRKGQSFRVHASKAWGYPSLELRAGNSWPAVTLDCDLPTVVDALHAVKSQFPLPVPNMEPDQIADSGLRAIYERSEAQEGLREARQAESVKKPARTGSYAHGSSMKLTIEKVCGRPDVTSKAKFIAMILSAHWPHVRPPIERLRRTMPGCSRFDRINRGE